MPYSSAVTKSSSITTCSLTRTQYSADALAGLQEAVHGSGSLSECSEPHLISLVSRLLTSRHPVAGRRHGASSLPVRCYLHRSTHISAAAWQLEPCCMSVKCSKQTSEQSMQG